MHTIALIAAADPFGSIKGLVAQAAAALGGLVVGIGTIYLIIVALKHMGKGWEKLLVAAGGVLLAVVVAGAAPGFMASAYQWGKQLGNGQTIDLNAQAGQ